MDVFQELYWINVIQALSCLVGFLGIVFVGVFVWMFVRLLTGQEIRTIHTRLLWTSGVCTAILMITALFLPSPELLKVRKDMCMTKIEQLKASPTPVK